MEGKQLGVFGSYLAYILPVIKDVSCLCHLYLADVSVWLSVQ